MFLAEVTAALPPVYKALADSNDWLRLTPELLLGALALLVLVESMFRTRREVWHTPLLIKVVLITIGCVELWSAIANETRTGLAFGGLIQQHGRETALMRLFFLGTAFAITHLGAVWLRRSKLPHTEFHVFTLIACAAMMLLAQSAHFVLFFVALETVAICLYALVGYNRESSASLEAGVKYLVVGGLSSALLLAGIVLLYGLGGNSALNASASDMDMLRFDHLREFIALNANLPLVKTGILLVLSGVAFKIGAFPFNLWIPDVYQGAPSPSAAMLAVGSKAAGVFALLALCVNPQSPFGAEAPVKYLLPVLMAAAAVTLLFGNLAALGQHKVKRLLGLSGISHAGFLLIGILAMMHAAKNGDNESLGLARHAIFFYLFAYLLASTVTFGVVGLVADENDAENRIHDYTGLSSRSSFLALTLAAGVGSLAGIPPSLGFIAKLLVVVAAFSADSALIPVVTIALVCVAFGIYYYFAWIREAFSRPDSASGEVQPIVVCVRSRIVLGSLAVILIFGFFAGLFIV